MKTGSFPSGSQFDDAIVAALSERPEPMSNAGIETAVAKRLGVTEDMLKIPHAPGRGTRTEFAYRLAWAKTRLKSKGRIERVGTKSWKLLLGDEGTAEH